MNFRIPDELIREVLLEVVVKFVVPRFIELKLNATGQWLRELEIDLTYNQGIIKGMHYSEQLVHGRKPQVKTHKQRVKWAYGMANYNPEFKNWLKVRNLEKYGFQIAYKIDKEGTEIYNKGGTDLLDVLEEPATVKYVYNRIGDWYSVQVARDLTRYAKQKLEVA